MALSLLQDHPHQESLPLSTINLSINQSQTAQFVRELLKRSEDATAKVGQRWVINTFDLGVCMKALPIIWRWPNEFAKHVTLAGPFHTSMNYNGMLTNHKMLVSGYKGILFEAQQVTSGSMKDVLTGKAYAKAVDRELLGGTKHTHL